MSGAAAGAEAFVALRPRLRALAYRFLASDSCAATARYLPSRFLLDLTDDFRGFIHGADDDFQFEVLIGHVLTSFQSGVTSLRVCGFPPLDAAPRLRQSRERRR